uniref:hypothetical protein n=1 Tax=Nonomuraea gerenzanensis TaxID=93944 RepID=UPI00287F54FC|nr:hypothetical protein [Nonomuraea gerenzanensis]
MAVAPPPGGAARMGAPAAEMYEFRLELLRPVESDDGSDDGQPLASATFDATYANAADVARAILPGLCEQARIPADPNEVYGRVSGRAAGGEFGFHDLVFLPGASVIDAPPGGF